ncbi:cc4be959-5eba-4185-9bfe-998847a39030 [Thermothielavioides terrestris]|uniref:C2H2 type master regulator of conidiophore development brlA n=1 Tax=Thermothielavioides terrestris TaxID=2587410 RepID=A0A3S4AJL9_9PEZI|nr:cc4be959-5eba-4185-9bfe-998847a39030 [Thermothielavioides terrestris]
MKPARDARGRRISLLNDDDGDLGSLATAASHPLPPLTASTPNTPQLLRADSYGYQSSTEPLSPMTPLSESAARFAPAVADSHSVFGEYGADAAPYGGAKRRPSVYSDGRPTSYENDAISTAAATEKRPKRYPCRFRDSLGCTGEFSTSGHASRHAKIHTQEKSVPCSFPGCPRKFTRNDNMKQHLATHNKDKPRSSASRRASAGTQPSQQPQQQPKRDDEPSPKRPSRKRSAAEAAAEERQLELSLPIHSRSILGRPGSEPPGVSGLDVLVMAAAQQEKEEGRSARLATRTRPFQ